MKRKKDKVHVPARFAGNREDRRFWLEKYHFCRSPIMGMDEKTARDWATRAVGVSVDCRTEKAGVKKTRAYSSGEKMGCAIVEMVHLMYQNETAKKFMAGLMRILSSEHKRRK